MKTDILVFTQTMHSLLKSSLSLQDSLRICSEILTSKKEKAIAEHILKGINEGKKLGTVLEDYKTLFPSIYISLVAIGEKSGNLVEVFGRLAEYLKDKKKLHQKMSQAMAYPIMVLFTAIVVIIILMSVVLPRLEDIFLAFTESSNSISLQVQRIKTNIMFIIIVSSVILLLTILFIVLHKVGGKFSFGIDSIILKIPYIGKSITAIQIYDFSFAMKILTYAHFPLTLGLEQSGKVLSNKRMAKAVHEVYLSVAQGYGTGESFEKQGVFPPYFCTWIKTAEYNGKIQEAFGNICDYYSSENENILTGITTFAEPLFILITGLIIICVIAQFVIPIFNIMGTL